MSKSKKIAVDKNLLNYMLSNVSEKTSLNKFSKSAYNMPLKAFFVDYKNYLAAQKLSPLTYIAFREEFEQILKYQYPSAQIIKRKGRFVVLNLMQSSFIEPKNTIA